MLTVTPSSYLITGNSHFLILCLGSHVYSVEYWLSPEFITDQIKFLAKKGKEKHLLWENNINALAHLLVSIATVTNDLKTRGFKQHKYKMQTKQKIKTKFLDMKASMYDLKNMLNLSNSRLDIVEENFSELRYQKKLFIVKTREEKIWIEET